MPKIRRNEFYELSVLHATYAKPQGIGVDEMNIWGDYFYMEALHRMLDPDWKLYW